jgi:hypothetical protein
MFASAVESAIVARGQHRVATHSLGPANAGVGDDTTIVMVVQTHEWHGGDYPGCPGATKNLPYDGPGNDGMSEADMTQKVVTNWRRKNLGLPLVAYYTIDLDFVVLQPPRDTLSRAGVSSRASQHPPDAKVFRSRTGLPRRLGVACAKPQELWLRPFTTRDTRSPFMPSRVAFQRHGCRSCSATRIRARPANARCIRRNNSRMLMLIA